MNRISDVFKNKKAVVGFLTAGDPSLDKTEEFIVEMERAGAGMIEIGIPFSDPIAEGTVIQAANVRALSVEGGCTTDMVFDMVKRVRTKVSVPFVFVVYLNTIFKYGYESFCEKCQEAGVSGIIVQDLPYEEKQELAPIAKAHGVDIISVIVPAPKERIEKIAKESSGYIYLVSVPGAVSTDPEIIADMNQIIKCIKNVTDTPVVIGVNNTKLNSSVAYKISADGVIVGNGTVNIIGKYGKDAAKPVYDYVKSLVEMV